MLSKGLLAGVLLFLTCCSPAAPGLVRIPAMEVLKSSVQHTGEGLLFDVQVQVINPNPFPIALQDIAGKWIVDGQVSHEVQVQDLSIPASSSSSTTLQTRAPLPASFKPERTHTFRFDAHYRLHSGSGLSAIQDHTLFQGSFQTKSIP
ncbi:hypothetical protein DC3_52420 [Deinococcus cellulosilyticus NBRC 106333 = KACC 11606]|uniref:Water stress and hypersensitive response domain-containing protein n=2 Tax=Deinococcus cellulosilyticus TaxID=401558 RepID=A0A511NAK2_DEIC1|nr:hypothetical protein DC3_52420 [Deinococcus cellulosilyticus NBRC 106333 = KACC 11606]